jgi:hypothetical protein
LSVNDGKKSIAMMSSINGIVGELFVDHPTNRSGQNPEDDTFKVKPISHIKELMKLALV